MAGRVDDIDARGLARFGVLPFDAGAFGEDGDAALFFQIAGIHRALFNALVVAERAGLAEELVNQRGFAVVNVSDDRDVAQ